MDQLDFLRKQLNAASVTDDMISRGVRLTSVGTKKLCSRLGVTEVELQGLLSDLAKQTRDDSPDTGLPASPDILEDANRFSFEADFMGNVTLRDSKTGATHYLQGSDGAKFLHEIDRIGTNYQGLIAPYFGENLLEFAQKKPTLADADTGGTYNFPFQGNFAVARFWLAGNKPMLEVVSVIDAEGEEVPLDAKAKADAEASAWEWVNKV